MSEQSHEPLLRNAEQDQARGYYNQQQLHHADAHVCGHQHFSNRGGWLRAGVMGATDGLVSIAGLMMGVAGSVSDRKTLLVSGVAGLVAGALSMAVGEFISVSSTRDSQAADIAKEKREQEQGPESRAAELQELTEIYIARGLSPVLARQVAEELSRDIESTVRAHARDELGIDIEDMANPFEAMLSSFVAFVFGAAFPLFAALPFDDYTVRTACVLGSSCIGLVLLGSVGGFLGGSSALLGASRVFAGGLIAMGITFGVGKMFGVALD